MKSYDKATWHIDGGEKVADVVERFREVFMFLNEHELLTEDGKETLEYGMDSSVSLNSTMLTKEGEDFLDKCYEDIISSNVKDIRTNLINEYNLFKDNN